MKFKIIYLVLCVSTIVMSAQQCLAITNSLDMHNQKSSDRIAIAAVGDSATSEISERAGRAPYYLFFDGNGVFLKALKNPSQKQGRRASSGVVDLLLNESVKTVIAGKFGDKMKNLLRTNKIEFYQHTGIARKVINELIKKQTE